MPQRDFPNFIDDSTPNIKEELSKRYDELSELELQQTQVGTSSPQLYSSLNKYVANPSTVSVETFKRMLDTDETIGAGIDFMNLALISRFGDFIHPVKAIQDFIRKAINNMDCSWHEALDEMFSAEWSGFSITEKIWKFEEDFDGAPAFVPKKLVTYPPLTMVFAVDRHGEVLPDGIYQYQRFHNTYLNAYGYGVNRIGDLNGFRPDTNASVGDYPYPIRIAADLSYLTVKINKSKCIHLRSSSTGKFNNPYGRSILRRVYKNWVLKDAFLKMWIVAADKKGTPLVVGYAAPNDTVQEDLQNKSNSNIRAQRADAAMANVFKSLHNSSYVVLPGKKGETYEVEAIQVQGDMNIFKDGIEYFNRAIMRGMLIPPLVMSAGDGAGSFALGQEHHKIFNRTCDGKIKPYKQGILEQFIRPMIAYNFPEDMWKHHGLGDFVLEEYDPDTMQILSQVYGNLTEKGYMTPEDQVDIDTVRQKMNLKLKKAVQPLPQLPGDGSEEESDNLPPGYDI